MVVKIHFKLLEARGDDAMENRFQVSANTPEDEISKIREYDGRRMMREFPFELPPYITVGIREYKEDPEYLQLGH